MACMNSPYRLLVIDDDKFLLASLQMIFSRAGYETLATDNGSQGIQMAVEHLPDLVLCDVMMPNPDGLEVIKTLSQQTSTSAIPFIFLTARNEKDHVVQGLNLGADDYISKPFTKAELLARVQAVLRRKAITQTEERTRAEAAIKSMRIELAGLFEKFSVDRVGLAEALAHMVALRDHETEEHGRRVVELTEQMASVIGFSTNEIYHIKLGALLHDIGKVGIPDAILLKPGALNTTERTEMERHPLLGFEIAKPIGLDPATLDLIQYHHERWDGNGYPSELMGEDIPHPARIFAVVDVWDALTNDRPYRKAWTKEQACKFIAEQAGFQFDPRVVEVFLGSGQIEVM